MYAFISILHVARFINLAALHSAIGYTYQDAPRNILLGRAKTLANLPTQIILEVSRQFLFLPYSTLKAFEAMQKL